MHFNDALCSLLRLDPWSWPGMTCLGTVHVLWMYTCFKNVLYMINTSLLLYEHSKVRKELAHRRTDGCSLLHSYILLFLCLYLLMHPAYAWLDPWSWPGMTRCRHCTVPWIFTRFQTKEHKNKSFIECSNVCSSELDIPLFFQCLHFQCLVFNSLVMKDKSCLFYVISLTCCSCTL